MSKRSLIFHTCTNFKSLFDHWATLRMFFFIITGKQRGQSVLWMDRVVICCKEMQRLTISGEGQICACSIEMAFETSTTKYFFDNCCCLYISMFGGGHCIDESLKDYNLGEQLCPWLTSIQINLGISLISDKAAW
nr:hypothetical protein CFP56_40778 [Quercus suber]